MLCKIYIRLMVSYLIIIARSKMNLFFTGIFPSRIHSIEREGSICNKTINRKGAWSSRRKWEIFAVIWSLSPLTKWLCLPALKTQSSYGCIDWENCHKGAHFGVSKSQANQGVMSKYQLERKIKHTHNFHRKEEELSNTRLWRRVFVGNFLQIAALEKVEILQLCQFPPAVQKVQQRETKNLMSTKWSQLQDLFIFKHIYP